VVDDEYKVKDFNSKNFMKGRKVLKLTKNRYDFNRLMKEVSYSNSPRYHAVMKERLRPTPFDPPKTYSEN
jgi:hypothetical protein